MRVLFLTGDVPFPTDTGARIRTFNLIKHTQLAAEVTLLTMAQEGTYAERRAQMKEYCTDVLYVTRPPMSKPALIRGLVRSLWSPRPFIADKHYFEPYAQKVAELCRSGQFDVVHCDSISLAATVPADCPIPTLLTEHNMEAVIWERYFEEEKNPLKRKYIRDQYHKVAAFEGEMCRRFDVVVSVSEDDRLRLAQSYKVHNVEVVPNGVDTDYFAPIPSETIANSLVFTGSMDWRPNQDAIMYFAESIWPLILQKSPHAHIWIVGRKPPEKIIALGKADRRITVTGRVDDVRKYSAPATVYIVPLRIGGGSRLKILEALAMQKAVVSTTIGAEGLDVKDGEDIVLADSPEEFATKVVELFDRPAFRTRLGEAGRDMVLKKYDWRTVAGTQLAAWQRAIDRRQEKIKAEGRESA
jgi:polysaccharide biosynthesis protein PslH